MEYDAEFNSLKITCSTQYPWPFLYEGHNAKSCNYQFHICLHYIINDWRVLYFVLTSDL